MEEERNKTEIERERENEGKKQEMKERHENGRWVVGKLEQFLKKYIKLISVIGMELLWGSGYQVNRDRK